MVGDGDLHLEHVGQGTQEPFGLPERKVRDHADRERCLDGDVRVGALTTGFATGQSPPGVQGSIGKPDGEVASTPKAYLVLSPFANPIWDFAYLYWLRRDGPPTSGRTKMTVPDLKTADIT